MKVLTTFLATLCAVAISQTAAHASSITYAFTAVVQNVSVTGDQSQVPNFTTGITPGLTTIAGTFTYDLAEPAAFVYSSGGGTAADYYAFRELTITFPSYAVDLTTFSANGNTVTIRNDTNFCCGANDQFVASGSTPIDAQGLRATYSINLFGNLANLNVFTNTDLPTSLDLASFPQRNLFLVMTTSSEAPSSPKAVATSAPL